MSRALKVSMHSVVGNQAMACSRKGSRVELYYTTFSLVVGARNGKNVRYIAISLTFFDCGWRERKKDDVGIRHAPQASTTISLFFFSSFQATTAASGCGTWRPRRACRRSRRTGRSSTRASSTSPSTRPSPSSPAPAQTPWQRSLSEIECWRDTDASRARKRREI